MATSIVSLGAARHCQRQWQRLARQVELEITDCRHVSPFGAQLAATAAAGGKTLVAWRRRRRRSVRIQSMNGLQVRLEQENRLARLDELNLNEVEPQIVHYILHIAA